MKGKRGEPAPRKIDYRINNGQLNLIGREISIPDVKFLDVLGEPGANGIVFKALDTKLDRWMAVKFWVPRHEGYRRHMEKALFEAKKLAGINHPNVAQIYRANEVEGLFVAALEFVQGITLRTWLKRNPDFGARCSAWYTVAETVKFLHGQGVFHGDLHPKNIMIDSKGQTKLIDFGTGAFTRSPLGSRFREGWVLKGTTFKVFSREKKLRVILKRLDYRNPEKTLAFLWDWVDTLDLLRRISKYLVLRDDYGVRSSLGKIATKIAERSSLNVCKLVRKLRKMGLGERYISIFREDIDGWVQALKREGEYYNGKSVRLVNGL